jgi:hypothetical protein
VRVRMRVLRRRMAFLRVIYYLFVAFDKFYLLEKQFDPTRNKRVRQIIVAIFEFSIVLVISWWKKIFNTT